MTVFEFSTERSFFLCSFGNHFSSAHHNWRKKNICTERFWQIEVAAFYSSPPFCLVLQVSDMVDVINYSITVESNCKAACCAVVRTAHKSGTALWQPVSHFTLTASVFTVINQWWPGGCHFTPCAARPQLGSAPQTHSRSWWGETQAHTCMHMHTPARTHKEKLYAQHKAVCWSNYRNMAEHDEAGPTIRKEIEWAEKKWWCH